MTCELYVTGIQISAATGFTVLGIAIGYMLARRLDKALSKSTLELEFEKGRAKGYEDREPHVQKLRDHIDHLTDIAGIAQAKRRVVAVDLHRCECGEVANLPDHETRWLLGAEVGLVCHSGSGCHVAGEKHISHHGVPPSAA